MLLFVAFIFTMSAAVWGIPDKTGELDDDQKDDSDQNDVTATDMVRIHLNNLFRFSSEILTSEKQEFKSRLTNILVLR